MHRVRAHFYVVAGLLCLALAYHLGAPDASAQGSRGKAPTPGGASVESSAASAYRKAKAVLSSTLLPTKEAELLPLQLHLAQFAKTDDKEWRFEGDDGTVVVQADAKGGTAIIVFLPSSPSTIPSEVLAGLIQKADRVTLEGPLELSLLFGIEHRTPAPDVRSIDMSESIVVNMASNTLSNVWFKKLWVER